jgi:hypothetical protein
MTTVKQDQETAPVPYYLRPNEMQREMNSRMADLVPELDSKFARTPMYRSRRYSPSDDYEEDVPCFISANEQEGKLKQDYIWMPKRKEDLQAGYYHVSTQEAFVQAYDLFRRRIPRRGLRRLCRKSISKLRIYCTLDVLLSFHQTTSMQLECDYFINDPRVEEPRRLEGPPICLHSRGQ